MNPDNLRFARGQSSRRRHPHDDPNRNPNRNPNHNPNHNP